MLLFAGWLSNELSEPASLPWSTTCSPKLCYVPGSMPNWERNGQPGAKTHHGALTEPTDPVGLKTGTM